MPYASIAERRRVAREWARKNYALNPAKPLAASRRWKEKNADKIRAYKRTRKHLDPLHRFLECYRTRLWHALKGGKKCARTCELLGMDLKEFRVYLQGQFRPGMTWENYGPVWHADHIRPCDSFDLSDPAQQRECFHWSNLQPLFAVENMKKGSSL